MAYQRWSYSDWYIYWDCSSGEERGDQILAINYALGHGGLYSYDHLIEDKGESVYQELAVKPTETNRMQFDMAMNEWLSDVELNYPNESEEQGSEQ